MTLGQLRKLLPQIPAEWDDLVLLCEEEGGYNLYRFECLTLIENHPPTHGGAGLSTFVLLGYPAWMPFPHPDATPIPVPKKLPL